MMQGPPGGRGPWPPGWPPGPQAPPGMSPQQQLQALVVAVREVVRAELSASGPILGPTLEQLLGPRFTRHVHSGVSDEIVNALRGSPQSVLDIAQGDLAALNAGCDGMATIHLHRSDVNELVLGPGEVGNAVLKGVCSYQDGQGGGEFEFDLTNGHILVVGATDAINVGAFFEPAVEGDPLVIGVSQKVEATVNWYTSVSGRDGIDTTPTITLVAAAPSALIPIPQQAHGMLVHTNASLAAEAGLIAEFLTSDVVGAPVLYNTTDPVHNGTLIGRGVRFVRFVHPTVGMLVTPFWSLWPG